MRLRIRTPFLAAAGLAAGLLLLTVGCSLNIEGQQSALDPKGPVAKNQYDIFMLTLYVTTFIFITVGGALAWVLWKFRQRKGDDPNFIPPQSHGHPMLEMGLVIASAGLLVIIAIPTFGGIILKKVVPEELLDGAIEVNVVGFQWWWAFEYPEQGFYTANELVFPAGRAVKINLRADDVIHSFWLPKLAGKVDLIPGQENFIWIMADEPGYFWGQCAEFCGDSHAYMLFRAIALPEDEWEEWLETQQRDTVADDGSFEPLLAREDWGYPEDKILKGAEVFRQACAGCHSVNPRIQTNGPNLAHFGSRTSVAAGWYENEYDLLYRWIREPEKVKPGNFMYRGFLDRDGRTVIMPGLKDYDLSDEEVHAVTAYLYTLR
ncbi:MAG: cytochrome c oxidase subunit II [Opitutales bacterium]|nr:cytochrome c oxidase subunit II [Opitutales bacterium]